MKMYATKAGTIVKEVQQLVTTAESEFQVPLKKRKKTQVLDN